MFCFSFYPIPFLLEALFAIFAVKRRQQQQQQQRRSGTLFQIPPLSLRSDLPGQFDKTKHKQGRAK